MFFFHVFLHVGLAIYRFDQLFRHRKTAFSVWNWEGFEHTRFNRVFFYPEDWAPQNSSCLIENTFLSSIHGGILLRFPDLPSAGWGDSGELSLFRRHLAAFQNHERVWGAWKKGAFIPEKVDPDQDMIAHGNSQKSLCLGEYYLGGPEVPYIHDNMLIVPTSFAF